MNDKAQLTSVTPASASRANKARTNLLLIAQREVINFKANRTKINSKSFEERIAEYDSIEIVILNPIERGNATHKASDDPSDFIYNQTCSIVELNINDEIVKFVENLNRTLFSERKLLKVQKNGEGTETISKQKTKKKTSEEISKKEKTALIKDSCHYLRRFCFNYIKKRRSKNRKTSKKSVNQQTSKSSDVLIQLNKATKSAMKPSSKGIGSENDGKHKSGFYKNKNSSISSTLLESKRENEGRKRHSLNGNSKLQSTRCNSEEISDSQSTCIQAFGFKRRKTMQFEKPPIEILEDSNDNENEDTIDEYNELRHE